MPLLDFRAMVRAIERLLPLLLCCGTEAARAQYTSAEQSLTWSTLNVNVQFHDNWRLIGDASYRWLNGPQQDVNNTYRIGIERKLGSWQVAGCYAYFVAHSYGAFPSGTTSTEQRIQEQATYTAKNGNVRWQHRLRFEHRNLERTVTLSDGAAVSERFWVFRPRYRTQLSWNIPFHKQPSRFTLHVFQELFLRFGPASIVRTRFDQQRLSAQLAFRIAQPLEFQAGYMFQDLVRNNGIQEERNHWLMLALNLDLDLTETKDGEAPAEGK